MSKRIAVGIKVWRAVILFAGLVAWHAVTLTGYALYKAREVRR
jgi:hypothetical protein